jgi:hypothetical protein
MASFYLELCVPVPRRVLRGVFCFLLALSLLTLSFLLWINLWHRTDERLVTIEHLAWATEHQVYPRMWIVFVLYSNVTCIELHCQVFLFGFYDLNLLSFFSPLNSRNVQLCPGLEIIRVYLNYFVHPKSGWLSDVLKQITRQTMYTDSKN